MPSAEIAEFFDRFGVLAGEIEDANGWQSDVLSSLAQIDAEFDANDRRLLEKLIGEKQTHIDSIENPYILNIQRDANNLLVESMDEHFGPLASKDVGTALVTLKEAMEDNADTLLKGNISSIGPTYGGSNHGNGVIALLITAPDVTGIGGAGGDVIQNMKRETLTFRCTDDAQDGGLDEGLEQFSVKGEAILDNLHRLWPAGSGYDRVVSSVSAAIEATSGPGGNLLVNGGFDRFTVTDTPDSWTLATATPGTTIKENTTDQMQGDGCLEIIGNGSELTRLEHIFGTDTTAKLSPNTPYTFSLWLKDGATAPTSGVLRISLRDSGDVELTDAEVSVALTALTSSWQNFKLSIWTPVDVPAGARFVVELTTVMPIGQSIFVDGGVVTQLRAVSPSGPYYTILGGSIPWHQGDSATVQVTKTGGDGKVQQWIDKVYDTYNRGLFLPNTAGTPSIPEAVIT